MTRFALQLGVMLAVLLFAPVPDRAAAEARASSQEMPIGQTQTLAETHWSGRVAWSDREAPDAEEWSLYFRSDGVLAYSARGATHDDGAWRQRGTLVTVETEDSVAIGAVRGDAIEGTVFTQDGRQGTWSARRSAAEPYACPHNLVALRGTTAPLVCICPENISSATVWGEPSSYTDDSDICTAAVHAGIVNAVTGGLIAVTPREGRESYRGSTANGVTTLPYGSWSGSYTIAEAKPPKSR